MADKDVTPPAGKKKLHPAILAGAILLLLVVLGIAQYMALPPATVIVDDKAAVTATDGTQQAQAGTIDVNAALADRVLGNTSAPLKISEHASFTCGHCGAFHRETFDQVKKEYIDTGKAYLVFSDFPLNEAALHATMVSRCLPSDKYFDFVHMLFKEQENWAYDRNYKEFLKTKAGESGLDETRFNACLENKELSDGIMNRMKGVQQQWNITSTPSFVLNNKNTISGALPYAEFKKHLDAELQGNATSPTTETTPVESTTPAVEPAAEAEDTPAPDAAPAAEAPADAPTEATPVTTESEGNGEAKPAE